MCSTDVIIFNAFSGGSGFIKRVPRVMKTNGSDQNSLTVQRSAHNANMVVQRSNLGESAVHTHVLPSMERRTFYDGVEGHGQRILCLDGGGIKVRRIELDKAHQ